MFNLIKGKSFLKVLQRFLAIIKAKVGRFLLNILYKKQCKKYKYIIQERKEKFLNFNSVLIPHSDKVYSDANIIECLLKYNIFITGSDQVWNFNRIRFYTKPIIRYNNYNWS